MPPDVGEDQELVIDRFWDQIARHRSAPAGDLDPTDVATIRHLHTFDDRPGPDRAFRARLREELVHAPAMPISSSLTGLDQRTGGVLPPPWTAEHRRWPAAQIATAALVLLTLIGSFVVIHGPLRVTNQREQSAIIPAIDSTPETVHPVGIIADDILVRATLNQMPPADGTHQIGLYRVQLAPGTVEHAGSQGDTGVGFDLFTVESGQITVEADGPVWLTRAVANPADMPSLVQPGTAIVLEVGDQLDVPSGVSFQRRNDGPGPATLLGFTIGNVGEAVYTWSNPAGVTYVHGLPYTLPSEFPALPAEATVHRLTLPPGAEAPVHDVPGLELVYVEAGALDLVYAKPATPATPERSFTIQAGSGTDTFGRTPDQALLANRGTESLVILTGSVVSTRVADPTAQASWSDGWGSGDHLPGEPIPD